MLPWDVLSGWAALLGHLMVAGSGSDDITTVAPPDRRKEAQRGSVASLRAHSYSFSVWGKL